MPIGLWIVLAAGYAWQPTCPEPGSFGEGLPEYCVSESPRTVTTPDFSARVPPGVRWGVCEDGSCLEIRALEAIPAYVIAVHGGELKGRLAGIDDVEALAAGMQGPMRPCRVEDNDGVVWVHCRHDYGEHPASERLDEGDYYRLLDGRWLGVRYTLSKGGDEARWRRRLEEFLHHLAPNR